MRQSKKYKAALSLVVFSQPESSREISEDSPQQEASWKRVGLLFRKAVTPQAAMLHGLQGGSWRQRYKWQQALIYSLDLSPNVASSRDLPWPSQELLSAYPLNSLAHIFLRLLKTLNYLFLPTPWLALLAFKVMRGKDYALSPPTNLPSLL